MYEVYLTGYFFLDSDPSSVSRKTTKTHDTRMVSHLAICIPLLDAFSNVNIEPDTEVVSVVLNYMVTVHAHV